MRCGRQAGEAEGQLLGRDTAASAHAALLSPVHPPCNAALVCSIPTIATTPAHPPCPPHRHGQAPVVEQGAGVDRVQHQAHQQQGGAHGHHAQHSGHQEQHAQVPLLWGGDREQGNQGASGRGRGVRHQRLLRHRAPPLPSIATPICLRPCTCTGAHSGGRRQQPRGAGRPSGLTGAGGGLDVVVAHGDEGAVVQQGDEHEHEHGQLEEVGELVVGVVDELSIGEAGRVGGVGGLPSRRSGLAAAAEVCAQHAPLPAPAPANPPRHQLTSLYCSGLVAFSCCIHVNSSGPWPSPVGGGVPLAQVTPLSTAQERREHVETRGAAGHGPGAAGCACPLARSHAPLCPRAPSPGRTLDLAGRVGQGRLLHADEAVKAGLAEGLGVKGKHGDEEEGQQLQRGRDTVCGGREEWGRVGWVRALATGKEAMLHPAPASRSPPQPGGKALAQPRQQRRHPASRRQRRLTVDEVLHALEDLAGDDDGVDDHRQAGVGQHNVGGGARRVGRACVGRGEREAGSAACRRGVAAESQRLASAGGECRRVQQAPPSPPPPARSTPAHRPRQCPHPPS